MKDDRAALAIKVLTDWATSLVEQGRTETARRVFLMAAEAIGVAEGLSAAPKSRTLTDMAQAEAAEPRRRGRPTKTKHPFPLALEAAGKTVAEWARENDLEREVVKSWFAPGAAGRRIPALWAQRIARQFKGVPATEDIWKNGIR